MRCEVCGNDYDKPMKIEYRGQQHVFDSFECAIKALAPRCDNCGTIVLGHGMEAGEEIYCSAHCAGQRGHPEMRDRVQ